MFALRGRIRSAIAATAAAAITLALLARGKLLTLALLAPFLAGLLLPWPLVVRTAAHLDPRGLWRPPEARPGRRADRSAAAFLAFFWLLVALVFLSLACLGVREASRRAGAFSAAPSRIDHAD